MFGRGKSQQNEPGNRHQTCAIEAGLPYVAEDRRANCLYKYGGVCISEWDVHVTEWIEDL
jgi:hypothetical protein